MDKSIVFFKYHPVYIVSNIILLIGTVFLFSLPSYVNVKEEFVVYLIIVIFYTLLTLFLVLRFIPFTIHLNKEKIVMCYFGIKIRSFDVENIKIDLYAEKNGSLMVIRYSIALADCDKMKKRLSIFDPNVIDFHLTLRKAKFIYYNSPNSIKETNPDFFDKIKRIEW